MPGVHDAHCDSNLWPLTVIMLNISMFLFILCILSGDLISVAFAHFSTSFCLMCGIDMCAYYCVDMLTCVCACGGQRSTLSVFLYLYLPKFWRDGLSLNPGFTISVRPTGQGAHRILPSLPVQYPGSECVPPCPAFM